MNSGSELIRFCHKVYEKEFVAAYDGNLSIRLDSSRVLITPSGKNKGELSENDLLEIDLEGKVLRGSGRVSSEFRLHTYIYKIRPELNAVVHCHPVYTTAFATAGEGFTTPVFPEFILHLGKVPLCRYATPSTEDLIRSIEPYAAFSHAFLLENHGAVTAGKDISDAYYKMEKLEHTAKTLFTARKLGREKTIPRFKLKELYEVAENKFGIIPDKRNKFI
ncbi:MAG: class II aldolase/adducin family protein [Ignavibacteriales bacterium]|nr:class II aldolase/adducin family protein [Ignavibacteriales bacterium]MCF8306066.1 class II aldolase/adducin family protein [Ignavibacteriales bacterium]MCF8315879.1 class II aldolase/adducin family protein [Ignavibacteriales bacterium]MCF8437339.1 class II aldolase/adducin family protein [Ignavibacteriales bacterium]